MEKYLPDPQLMQEETKKEPSISLDKIIEDAKTKASKLNRKPAYPEPEGKDPTKQSKYYTRKSLYIRDFRFITSLLIPLAPVYKHGIKQ